MTAREAGLRDIVAKNEREILSEWIESQFGAGTARPDLMKSDELREQSRRFLEFFRKGLQDGDADVNSAAWAGVRELLGEISQSRARQGFSPAETAMFRLLAEGAALSRVCARSWRVIRKRSPTRPGPTTALLDRLGLLHDRGLPERPRGGHRAPAAGDAGAVDAGGQALGGRPGAAADRHARQRAHAGRDGEPAADASSTPGAGHRDHRHHRRPDRRHAGRAAPAQDRHRGAADGRRLHHQRHPPADRPDHRPPRRRSVQRDHQGHPGGRLRARARAAGPDGHARVHRRRRATGHGTDPDPEDGRLPAGHASRSTCTTAWRWRCRTT